MRVFGLRSVARALRCRIGREFRSCNVRHAQALPVPSRMRARDCMLHHSLSPDLKHVELCYKAAYVQGERGMSRATRIAITSRGSTRGAPA